MKRAAMIHLGSNPYLQMKAKQWTESLKFKEKDKPPWQKYSKNQE
jgi:hypothetical protein|tara:strand:+ start:531 stop:665 length:135 start_codon:yes stop_codon:yes gene_type:complete